MIKWKKNPRRGISTVVGALFFLILMTSSLSVVFLALDTQNELINSQQSITKNEIKKIREQYSISVSTDPINDNKLSVLVKNEGIYPVEISRLWIINKTDSANDYPVKAYNLTGIATVIPPGYGADIVANQPLHMIPDTYDVKVVSTLGTIHTEELFAGGANKLRAEVFTIPPDVKIGQNTTLAMHVTNIGKSRIYDVAPQQLIITPSSGVATPLPPNPIPITLDPAESTIFTWKFKVNGTAGSFVSFSGNATGTEAITGYFVKSNDDSDSVKLQAPDSSEIIVLTQDLLSRPEIFMVIPSPFGDAPEHALWGANIVNPTGQEMYVSKVTISVFSPRANSQDVMLDSSSGTDKCNPLTVAPTPSNWSCPSHNQLMWQDLDTPQRIAPYSVFPFLAKVHPGGVASSALLESVIVHVDVFTTVGEFGKAGYSTSFDNRNSDTSMVNVYLSTVPDSTLSSNIYVNKTGILSSSSQTFNVVLADFEKGTTNEIDASSRLIINVPRGWTVNPASINGFGDFTTSYQTFSDTSSQIIGDLVSAIDGSGPAGLEGKTIQFSATAPIVTNPQMYVMYVLADGKVTNGNPSEDFAIGPTSEVVLQVVP